MFTRLFYSTSNLMYALRLEMNPIVNSSVQSVLYRAGKLPSWLPRISMARSTIPLTGATSAAHWVSKQATITASWNSRFIPVISNVALVARSYLVMSSTSSLMALWRPLISQQLLHCGIPPFFQIKIGSVAGCTRGSGFRVNAALISIGLQALVENLMHQAWKEHRRAEHSLRPRLWNKGAGGVLRKTSCRQSHVTGPSGLSEVHFQRLSLGNRSQLDFRKGQVAHMASRRFGTASSPDDQSPCCFFGIPASLSTGKAEARIK